MSSYIVAGLVVLLAFFVFLQGVFALAGSVNDCQYYSFPLVHDRTGYDHDGKTVLKCYKGEVVDFR